jgi:hypothetical protein
MSKATFGKVIGKGKDGTVLGTFTNATEFKMWVTQPRKLRRSPCAISCGRRMHVKSTWSTIVFGLAGVNISA